MQSLKRLTISFFSILLCTVLGVLLFLGEPAFADITEGECIDTCSILEPGASENLAPNQAYQVILIKDDSGMCSGDPNDLNDPNNPNAYAELTFNGFGAFGSNVYFQETYPIQKNWPLSFNTPLYNSDTDDASTIPNSSDIGYDTLFLSGSITNGSNCRQLALIPGEQLELLSGFKGVDSSGNQNDSSGHFIVAKDYYANTGDGSYEYLGSLTSSKGVDTPALGGVTVAQLIIAPNSIRAPHWHLQWLETGYCYHGLGQVGVIVPGNVIPNPDGSGFISESRVEEIFIKPHELFVFPQGSQHYLRNIGSAEDGNLACTLFFADGVPLNEDALLTITLQALVGSTPLGVLGPVLVMDSDPASNIPYTPERLAASPDQTYSSVDQGPDIVEVVKCKRGVDPNIDPSTCE